MKKEHVIFILIFLSNAVFAESYVLDNIENNHNFNPPANTISKIIKSRSNINNIQKYIVPNPSLVKKIYTDFSRARTIDLSKIQEFRSCSYIDRSRANITAEFRKKKNSWVLNKVYRNKKIIKQKNLFKGSYKLHESNTCFGYFVRKWEKIYKKSKLRLSHENARITNVRLLIDQQPLIATFNLMYVYPKQNTYNNGWLVDSFFLKKSNFKKIVNMPLPKSEQAFHVEKVLSKAEMKNANIRRPNQITYPQGAMKNDLPILERLICHHKKQEKRIRFSFQINQAIPASALIQTYSEDNKYYTFALNSKRTDIKYNNCNFLVIGEREGLFDINITKFRKHIRGIKNGFGKNTSYIDFFY